MSHPSQSSQQRERALAYADTVRGAAQPDEAGVERLALEHQVGLGLIEAVVYLGDVMREAIELGQDGTL